MFGTILWPHAGSETALEGTSLEGYLKASHLWHQKYIILLLIVLFAQKGK
jgi:hypothetical protein